MKRLHQIKITITITILIHILYVLHINTKALWYYNILSINIIVCLITKYYKLRFNNVIRNIEPVNNDNINILQCKLIIDVNIQIFCKINNIIYYNPLFKKLFYYVYVIKNNYI